MKDLLLTRRESLSAGAAAAASLSLPGSGFAATLAKEQISKPIPSSGERLPVIGLGTNQFSVEKPEELLALQQVLESMAALGGKVVDTARAYGRSEEVIGGLLKKSGKRSQFFISTKTPINGTLRGADEEVRASFERLQVEMVDLMLIHNLHGLEQLMPALIKAKKERRVRYIGMSTSEDSQYEAQMAGMRRFPLDFIQVDYSIGNRSAEPMLQLAQERKIAVLVNSPFGGRRNAATTTFGKVAGKPLPGWAADIDAQSWAQFFLKYVVSHPAVTAAIPGTIKVSHILDNQGAGRGRLPNAAMRRRMEQYWETV